MPKRLTDIDVTFISLVRKGANRKTVIFKSDEGEKLKDIEIKKYDDKKGMVYGIVYAPDEIDAQGDFAKAEDIEKASHNFMRNLHNYNVDKNHSFKKEDAVVVENWIVRKNDELFPEEKQGAWAVGIKVESDELKKEISDGVITGLSMAGTAIRKSEEDNLLTKIKKLFEGKEEMDEKKVQEMIDNSIKKAQDESPHRTDEDMAKLMKSVLDALEIEKSIKEVKETVEKMSKENPGSVQEEDKPDDLKKQDEEGEKIAEIIKNMTGEE